jgi:hypothetical protein
MAVSGGGLGGAAALLPALGVLFVFAFGVAHSEPGRLLAIAGSATAAIAVASALIVGRRFSPETVLEP